jgi:hypothetical protein
MKARLYLPSPWRGTLAELKAAIAACHDPRRIADCLPKGLK